MFLRELNNSFDISPGQHLAGRVARVDDDYGARLALAGGGRERSLQLVHVQTPRVILVKVVANLQHNRAGSANTGEGLVVSRNE